jgi:2'-5' RNA ligase
MPTIGVSIPVPAPYGEELQGCRRELGDPMADAIPSHVTLLPPTEVDEDAVPWVHEHLAKVAETWRPFTMVLRGTGTFRPVSPVVFVQVAGGIADCEQLQLAVRQGPVERELRFPYHPHVTVAHDVPEEAMDRAFDRLATYHCSFPVTGFDLYRHGADRVWRSVATFPFTPQEAARG